MNFIDNTNKFTCVKIYTFTYNPQRLQHISCSDGPQEVYIKRPYNTDELANRLKFVVLKNCRYLSVCCRCVCQIGPYDTDITELQNYKCSEK
jgi:hypothetical protein